MAEIHMDGQTRVFWTAAGSAPVELPVEGVRIRMQHVYPEEPFLSTYAMKPITMRFKGRATPRLYKMLFGRQHPRIRRMHMAYSRKRGRGRR